MKFEIKGKQISYNSTIRGIQVIRITVRVIEVLYCISYSVENNKYENFSDYFEVKIFQFIFK